MVLQNLYPLQNYKFIIERKKKEIKNKQSIRLSFSLAKRLKNILDFHKPYR